MILYLRRLGRGGNVFGELLKQKISTRKRIVVDFSSPNIAKQFHIGNLRSTLIGEFFCKLNRIVGNEVIALNYLGDWGTQMALLTAHWPNSEAKKQFEEMPPDAKLADRLLPLMDCYVEAYSLCDKNPLIRKEQAIQLLDKMEDALVSKRMDDPSLAIWSQMRKLSVDYLTDFYKRLGINFDVWDAESYYVAEARRLARSFIDEGRVATTVEGLKVVHDREVGGYFIVGKSSSNSSLYLTRELAATIARHDRFNADSYVYVVDNEQARHFRHLGTFLNLHGRDDISSKIHHVGFGRVVGFSTRKGVVKLVDSLLEEGVDAAEKYIKQSATIKVTDEELPEVCKELSEAGLVLSDLQRHRNTNYTFGFEKIFKKHTRMFYLHEKYARLCSLIDNNADLLQELDKRLQTDMSNLSLETDPTARVLFQCLYELDGSLYTAFTTTESSPLINYLIRLCDCLGPAVSELRLKNEPNRQVALNRLLLFVAAKNVMTEGFQLLGMRPLSRI
ncbi:Arginyl-tRNA synthetase [Aphelenchoides bicaudatus]|nr:Arginyl-tRNA synthetase [Aphelenchoides bicaudatus]